MARLYPRVEVNLPVELDIKFWEIGVFENISADGVLIRSFSPTTVKKIVGRTVLLKYALSRFGIFEHSAKIIRNERYRYALRFHNLELSKKRKLWSYIVDNLNPHK